MSASVLSGKRESDKDRDMERLGGFGSLGFEESDVVLVRVAMVFDNVGLFEFMSIVMPITVELDLQVSLLKVEFSRLLYTFDMLLCHAF
ncbi:hypothetical protein Tco_0727449 [Tanacetum coccineum]|uniref:Uncharacterized protein n=1 Tax=Tanacetum coccineum TaxID=301880 RepID=A0ABQ4YLE9_9ASTR